MLFYMSAGERVDGRRSFRIWKCVIDCVDVACFTLFLGREEGSCGQDAEKGKEREEGQNEKSHEGSEDP